MPTDEEIIEGLKQSIQFDEIVAGTIAPKIGQKTPSPELVAALKERMDPKLVKALASVLRK